MISVHPVRLEGALLQEAASFIAAQQRRVERAVPYLGDEIGQIVKEVTEYGASDISVVVRDDGRLVGVCSVEFDLDLRKAYIYGPFIGSADWLGVADRMWGQLLKKLPAEDVLFEMYFTLENHIGEQFARRHGFTFYKRARLMRFDESMLPNLPSGEAPDVTPAQAGAVAELHDRLFPGTWLTGARMIEGLGEFKRCFVIADGIEVVSYLYAETMPPVHDALLAFVGTREGNRRKGAASTLVSAALRWMLSYDTITEVFLSVDEDNVGARRLYERLGWQIGWLTQAFRRQI